MLFFLAAPLPFKYMPCPHNLFEAISAVRTNHFSKLSSYSTSVIELLFIGEVTVPSQLPNLRNIFGKMSFVKTIGQTMKNLIDREIFAQKVYPDTTVPWL